MLVTLVITPMLLLSVKGWLTSSIAISVLWSSYILTLNKEKITNQLNNSVDHSWKINFCLLLAIPFASVFLGQLFRQDFSWKPYDSPAHILICIPIFLAIIQSKENFTKNVSLTFPIIVFAGLIAVTLNPNFYWGYDRVTTYALDPLAFGSLSLTFGLLSLVSIELHAEKSNLIKLYLLTGFFVGCYLSILSGSRTGWMALPITFIVWLSFKKTKSKVPYTSATIAVMVLAAGLTYQYSGQVKNRVDITIKEVKEYQWNQTNPDTSVGARISFARIAIYLFEKKPLSGWGDAAFASELNKPELNFAEMDTKKTALNAGFHNEITGNMVRSGVWGLISSVLLFAIPAWFFASNLKHTDNSVSKTALLACIFLICQFISSMSNELLTLKYAATLYGFMIALFAGSILAQSQTSKIQKPE